MIRTGTDTALDVTLRAGDAPPLRCRFTLSAVMDGGAVLGALLCVVDVTELAERAHVDGLTGLRNRASILAALDEVLAAPDRLVGLALADLDGFKDVNDRSGHAAGDALLQRVGSALACTPGAEVGRLGGDEFLVVFPDVSGPAELDECASRLEAALVGCGVGASVGTALVTGGTDASTAVEAADRAMYGVKQQHRLDRRTARRGRVAT